MATYKQLQRDPASRDLFNKRITTIQGLRNALEDSAFLAIDTEHVAITSEKDRILHQVGLAYLQTLIQQDSPQSDITSLSTSQPYLQKFYIKNQIQALTLNLNISKEKQDDLIRLKGSRGLPTRRTHRFGIEQQIDFENLEAAIVDFIHSCSNKTNLVMIGFEMAAEWTYLSRNFPQAIAFFSAWVDLRDIAKDVTSSVGVIPGLVSLLKIFGYHWKDIQPGKEKPSDGIADNAGDDAVATCALANALLLSENQEKLRFRQECGQIACIFTRKKGYRFSEIRDPFTATIHSRLTKASNLIAIIVSSTLPVLTIFVLNTLKSTTIRLGLTVLFTALFSILLAFFSLAKRAEIFAATATFAAVEVVFIGSALSS
ncbi:hypothetical protein B0T10DRAFT_607821 [Thelonectria olida]|uniref:DUF6594 domain-containing protein n=1 Tax=Thelonectria olida TaxID=1576542 RepID=A0A9P9AR20_9HYPO|nr:hypothetical protein B0T10DRAFT_607821 [Thelonectria olida]